MTPEGHCTKAMASYISIGLQVAVAGSIKLYGCENTRKRSMGFSSSMDLSEHDTREEEGSDEFLYFGEKKRRLTSEQVKTLEKSFEVGNKLELERKIQLAKALGLQPRQIAVWFQNRRAKCRTMQLERDFDMLNQEYGVLKSKYDILLQENRQFKDKVQRLNRELEKIHDNRKARGFKIESHQKLGNPVFKPTNSPIELSVKKEIAINCSDPLHYVYPMISKEAASSAFNIHRGTLESSPSPVSLISVDTNSSSICLEGYSVRQQVTGGGLETHPAGHLSRCLPKVEVDQSGIHQAEDNRCNLFCSFEGQNRLMLRE